MAAPPPSALARPSRRARFLPVGGLGPPRPHPGGASAARRSGPPTRPGFPYCGGLCPPRPRRVRCPRRGFEGSRAFCPGEAAPLALPVGHGARGADSRAAARSVRGRPRSSRSPSGTAHAARIRGQPRVLSGAGRAPRAPRRARRTRRGFEGSRAFCPGQAALLALPVGHGARGADSRAAARSVRGRLRPSRSPPVRCPRRGFEGSRASCPGEAAPSRSPSGTAPAARIRGQPRVLSGGGCAPHAPRRSGARGADSRAAARPVRGRLRPPRSPPVRCPRRGFEGSRASCPGEAAPPTLPAGPVPAARIRGQPRVLSGGGCGPHAPRRSGARGADSRGARPPFSARERATVMVRPLQN